ncbi:helix-turn-helix domain-containing protein [Dermacoccus sp. PAMC28757]|uniref:helix-turn-helix domain-containing protein n=1 Tax=Dermacoccus sp. PAMC28757 TaxID=2762331 RepID=UPI00351C9BF4
MPARRDLADEARQLRWQHTRLVVGSNIRRLRLSRGLTQEALALESGLSRNQLIEVEHGRRGLMFERLVDLADVLEAGVDEFFRPTSGE